MKGRFSFSTGIVSIFKSEVDRLAVFISTFLVATWLVFHMTCMSPFSGQFPSSGLSFSVRFSSSGFSTSWPIGPVAGWTRPQRRMVVDSETWMVVEKYCQQIKNRFIPINYINEYVVLSLPLWYSIVWFIKSNIKTIILSRNDFSSSGGQSERRLLYVITTNCRFIVIFHTYCCCIKHISSTNLFLRSR